MAELMVAKARWTVLGSEELLHAPPYVTVTRERVRTESGAEISDFYRVDLAPFVVCVPQTTNGRIITLWQYKHGPRRYGLTFPAGYVDAGEDPEEACARELMEETGYHASDWRSLGRYVDHGNQRGSIGSYYFASGCEIAGHPDSGDLEEMELRLMTVDEVDAAFDAGEISIIHHVAVWCLARRFLI